MISLGKQLRLSRIINPDDGRAVVVAADHGLMLGPIKGVIELEKTLRRVVEGGADAILMSPGQAVNLSRLFYGRGSPALLIRADWSNAFRDRTYTLPARKVRYKPIATVRQALALGASGIVTYFFVGYGDDEDEAKHLKMVSKFSKECGRLGMPLIVEPIPLGPRVTKANFVDLVGLCVRMAVEAGADIIKAPYTGDVESFRKVVKASCGTPILILGGYRALTQRDSLEVVAEALEAGSAGVVFGRNVIQALDPAEMVRGIRAIVHEGRSVKEVLYKTWVGPLKLKVNLGKCVGCSICELACSFSHIGSFNQAEARLRIALTGPARLSTPIVCTLCGECLKACPKEALNHHPRLGYIQVLKEVCDGCRRCVEACPLGLVKFDEGSRLPLICDMCRGAPECVEWCYRGAIEVVEGLKG